MNYDVKTTIPVQAATAVTATGNSPVFVLPSANGVLEVLVNVSAISGTSPSLTPTLQVSNDGANWFTAASGSAMTSVSTQRLACQTLCGYARVAFAVSGTTPSLTTSLMALAN
jgi:benzoyl-CoA reductase/2-hydroxyglutaryl-CoA dehydratase subunit BcrC/BadD/HgdB